jgi:hypothetical protein
VPWAIHVRSICSLIHPCPLPCVRTRAPCPWRPTSQALPLFSVRITSSVCACSLRSCYPHDHSHVLHHGAPPTPASAHAPLHASVRHAPHLYSQHCMRLAEADDARPIQTRRRMPHHPCALHLSSIGALVVRLGAVGRRRVQIAQLHRRYARHTTAPDQSDRKRFTRHSDRANPTRTLLYL